MSARARRRSALGVLRALELGWMTIDQARVSLMELVDADHVAREDRFNPERLAPPAPIPIPTIDGVELEVLLADPEAARARWHEAPWYQQRLTDPDPPADPQAYDAIARRMAHARSRAIAHRDLKPDNAPAPGCSCGTSAEVRAAYAAVGGWWHVEGCPRAAGDPEHTLEAAARASTWPPSTRALGPYRDPWLPPAPRSLAEAPHAAGLRRVSRRARRAKAAWKARAIRRAIYADPVSALDGARDLAEAFQVAEVIARAPEEVRRRAELDWVAKRTAELLPESMARAHGPPGKTHLSAHDAVALIAPWPRKTSGPARDEPPLWLVGAALHGREDEVLRAGRGEGRPGAMGALWRRLRALVGGSRGRGAG